MRAKNDATITVCYALRGGEDNILYGRFECASIASLLANSTRQIELHILTNALLAEPIKKEIRALAEQYSAIVAFHEIELANNMLTLPALDVFDSGNLFRLYIDRLVGAERTLYLDADTIVNMDIAELWDLPLDGVAVMGCLDEGFQRGWVNYDLALIGLPGEKSYFNAGVLVLNLRRIREHYGGLLTHVMKFFQQYPHNRYMDQDALNYVFAKDKKILPRKYNTYIAGERADGKQEIQNCIYHSASENGRVRYQHCDCYDQLFLKYFSLTAWGSKKENLYKLKLEVKQRQYDTLLQSYQKIYSGKIVFWGSGGQLDEIVRSKFTVDATHAYYVDNNPHKWQTYWHGLVVHPPKVLQKEREAYSIIVLSKNYRPIKKQLLELGLVENRDFFDGRKFLTAAEGGYPEWNII